MIWPVIRYTAGSIFGGVKQVLEYYSMNTLKLVKSFLVLLLLAAACVGNAWADHRGHTRFGLVIGAPLFYPYPHPYPYYYPPYQPVIIERAPPVYIEQPVSQPAPAVQEQQTNYWYYCSASKAYYPYVKECPGGWQKVLPQPPAQP